MDGHPAISGSVEFWKTDDGLCPSDVDITLKMRLSVPCDCSAEDDLTTLARAPLAQQRDAFIGQLPSDEVSGMIRSIHGS